MIHLIKEQINEIPILHVVQDHLHEQALPTVVYYHGYNGEKISSLTLAYKIAEKGFRVILPDSLYHGERQAGLTESEMDLAFWEIVMQNITELDEIKTYLVDKGYSLPDRIGIGGTSMGGITTYGALCTYDWLKTAASLMGTAYLTEYAQELIDYYNKNNQQPIPARDVDEVFTMLKSFDLSFQPEKLAMRPLLIWHGTDDEVVPYHYSETFYQLVKKQYHDKAAIRFVSQKGRAHQISNLSMNEAADWFERHL